jgi:hypothetical protein
MAASGFHRQRRIPHGSAPDFPQRGMERVHVSMMQFKNLRK